MANYLDADTSAQRGLAIDANSLNQLKTLSKTDSKAAVKQAAQQFEAMFLNMVMKSMRDATPKYNEFDSEQSKMFISMLDQEMTQNLAKKGIGLGEILERQLSQNQSKTAEEWEKEGGAKAPSTVTDLHPKVNTTLEKVYSNQMHYTKMASDGSPVLNVNTKSETKKSSQK